MSDAMIRVKTELAPNQILIADFNNISHHWHPLRQATPEAGARGSVSVQPGAAQEAQPAL